MMGARPQTPRIFRISAIPNARKQKGRGFAPFGLAPWSALELRPRRALSSAKVSNSVADNHRRTSTARQRSQKRQLLFGNIFF